MASMGIELVDVQAGAVELKMRFDPAFAQQHGFTESTIRVKTSKVRAKLRKMMWIRRLSASFMKAKQLKPNRREEPPYTDWLNS